MTQYETANALENAAMALAQHVPRNDEGGQLGIETPAQKALLAAVVTALADYKSATIQTAQVQSKTNPVSIHIWLLAGRLRSAGPPGYAGETRVKDEDGTLCGHGGEVHPWEWTDGHAAVDSATGGVTCRDCLDRWEAAAR